MSLSWQISTWLKGILIGIAIVLVCVSLFPSRSQRVLAHEYEPGFVDLNSIAPSIQLEIRYFGDDNFIGQPIDGYLAPKCLLTQAAAEALQRVQIDLLQQSYALRVYDCYRPQRAVDHFIRWARDLSDTKMKSQYYPNIPKSSLFQGYIASRSGHSRGSTVDLTLVALSPQATPADPENQATVVDMGSPFDFFDPISHTWSQQITAPQQDHRILLKTAMERQGFENYSREWWHYTLKNEPYPATYFTFPVQ